MSSSAAARSGRLLRPHLIRQHVGCSRGQSAEGHVGTGHPVHRFVNRPVATRRQYQIAPLFNGAPCQLPRLVRARCGEQFHVMPGAQEHLHRVVEPRLLSAPQSSRKRIVDNANIMGWLRDNFRASRFLTGPAPNPL